MSNFMKFHIYIVDSAVWAFVAYSLANLFANPIAQATVFIFVMCYSICAWTEVNKQNIK